MRFHTAVNRFCLDASLDKDIHVYKTALNQFRPYLSLMMLLNYLNSQLKIIFLKMIFIMLCLKIVQ